MNEEFNDVVKLLRRVLPQLIKNPVLMQGCDVSDEEIRSIITIGKLSLDVLENLAGDTFFEVYFEELGITESEAHEISMFLQRTAKYYLKELKKKVPYIE